MHREVHGSNPTARGEGMLRRVLFPSLVVMDERTGDGRMLLSEGRGVRDLPRPIYFQEAQADGHDGAIGVGSLREVTFHEDGSVSGAGWLIDTEAGRTAALHISTQTIFHNSVDLNESVVRIDWDDNDELIIDFTSWKIGGTTLVGSPAFANAHAALSDELVASAFTDEEPLVCDAPLEIWMDAPSEEVTASSTVAWEDFYIAEADGPTKIVVDATGRVYGHLAIWDTCHEGYVDRCMRVPRPVDGYASFNQAGPLTERGQVNTGPVFFLGGHPKAPLGSNDAYAAYGGVENCWADVRTIEGRFGPWISGRVRPGVDDDSVYAARASRISGHWVNGALRAIVSCNVPGYPVDGLDFAADGFKMHDGKVLELVASFPPCIEEVDPQSLLDPGVEVPIEAVDPAVVEAAYGETVEELERQYEATRLALALDDD